MLIYKITNTINGKAYIGKTADLARRMREHFNKRRHFIGKAISKYGAQAFTVEVLFDGIEEEQELNRLEANCIEQHKSHDERFGYNLTLGGEGTRCGDALREARRIASTGRKHSEETRALFSEQRRGRAQPRHVIEGLRRAASRPKTEETKRRMSEAARTRGADSEYRKMMSDATKGKRKSAAHIANLKEAAKQRRRNARGVFA